MPPLYSGTSLSNKKWRNLNKGHFDYVESTRDSSVTYTLMQSSVEQLHQVERRLFHASDTSEHVPPRTEAVNTL